MSDSSAAGGGNGVAAGWYTDPYDAGQLRWWDGTAWTEHVTPPSAPAPAAEEAQPEVSQPAEEAVPAEAANEAVASDPVAAEPVSAEPAAAEPAAEEAAATEPAAQEPELIIVEPFTAESLPVFPVDETPEPSAWAERAAEPNPFPSRRALREGTAEPVVAPVAAAPLAAEPVAAAPVVAAPAPEPAAPNVPVSLWEQASAETAQPASPEPQPDAAPAESITEPTAEPVDGTIEDEAEPTLESTFGLPLDEPEATSPSDPLSDFSLAAADPSAGSPAPFGSPVEPAPFDSAAAAAQPTVAPWALVPSAPEAPSAPTAPGALTTVTPTETEQPAVPAEFVAGGRRSRAAAPPVPAATVWAWLIVISPLLAALIVGYVLASEGSNKVGLLVFLAVLAPYLLVILFAAGDRSRLVASGQDRATPFTWAALTAPVYLVMRAAALRRDGATGNLLLILWGVAFVVAIAGLLLYGVVTRAPLLPGLPGAR